MIFKRKIYDELLEWKKTSAGTSAVLIEGARRTGKSTIVEAFAAQEYEAYYLIDFAKAGNDLRSCFEYIDHPDRFFRDLFLIRGASLPEHKSAIIFDEVQRFPRAREAIKYLVADGRYDYIETGSLISIKKNVKDILIPSEEDRLEMYPMDFEEFLWASGDEMTWPSIRDAFEKKEPFSDAIHRKIMQVFRAYMAVGGMPQAVDAFVSGKTYQEIDRVKRRILKLYEEDLGKYDEETGTHAAAVFKTLPKQLENHNSHFKFSLLDKNARYKNYVSAINSVVKSMIGNECIGVTAPEISMELYADRSNFKLYMGDTGLLVTQILKNNKDTDDNIYRSLIFNHAGFNMGMIMENMVAQIFRTGGKGLYFHEYEYRSEASERERKYEIDFLLVRNGRICPIEVKSSGTGKHKSFDYFLQKYPVKVRERYIISTKQMKTEGNLVYLPVYMTGCL